MLLAYRVPDAEVVKGAYAGLCLQVLASKLHMHAWWLNANLFASLFMLSNES